MRRRTARLPVTLLAFFFRQLATLVGSGIPLVQAWQLLMADMPGHYRRPLHLAALSGPASRQGTSKDSAVSWPISMKPRGRSGASSSRPWPIRPSCWSA